MQGLIDWNLTQNKPRYAPLDIELKLGITTSWWGTNFGPYSTHFSHGSFLIGFRYA